MEAGAPKSAEVARKISALLEGENLDPDTVLLGAVLRIPTYRRDLEFRFWLTASGAETLSRNVISSTPGWPDTRKLASRLVLRCESAAGGNIGSICRHLGELSQQRVGCDANGPMVTGMEMGARSAKRSSLSLALWRSCRLA